MSYHSIAAHHADGQRDFICKARHIITQTIAAEAHVANPPNSIPDRQENSRPTASARAPYPDRPAPSPEQENAEAKWSSRLSLSEEEVFYLRDHYIIVPRRPRLKDLFSRREGLVRSRSLASALGVLLGVFAITVGTYFYARAGGVNYTFAMQRQLAVASTNSERVIVLAQLLKQPSAVVNGLNFGESLSSLVPTNPDKFYVGNGFPPEDSEEQCLKTPEACNAADLSGIDLSGSTGAPSLVQNSRFDGVNFDGARISGIDFSSVSFAAASFAGARLHSNMFEGVDMAYAHLASTLFEGNNWGAVNLEGASLIGARLVGNTYSGPINVSGTRFCLYAGQPNCNVPPAEFWQQAWYWPDNPPVGVDLGGIAADGATACPSPSIWLSGLRGVISLETCHRPVLIGPGFQPGRTGAAPSLSTDRPSYP